MKTYLVVVVALSLNPPKGLLPISTSSRPSAGTSNSRAVSIPRRVSCRFPRWGRYHRRWGGHLVSIPRRVSCRFPPHFREHARTTKPMSQSPEGSPADFHASSLADDEGITCCLNPPKGLLPISTQQGGYLMTIFIGVSIPRRVSCRFPHYTRTNGGQEAYGVSIPRRVSCRFPPRLSQPPTNGGM